MAQKLPRTRLNSSRLVRVLADLAETNLPEPKQPFGERLGQWLDFPDALTLFSVLSTGATGASDVCGGWITRTAAANPAQKNAVRGERDKKRKSGRGNAS